MIRRLLVLALCCGAWACSDPEPRTKITFRLEASPALQDAIARLDVQVTSERTTSSRSFPSDQLNWAVEIVVVPEGDNRATHTVNLVAVAVDGSGRQLAEWRSSKAFAPREQLSENIAAAMADGPPSDGFDAGVDGGSPLPRADAGTQDAAPVLDASEEPDAASDAATDSDTGARIVNCATPNSGLQCNDDNACNGTEFCDPANAGADERGCVASETMISCMSGSTCDSASGECSTCLVKADGDGDGARSTSCDGHDCNDNDPTIAPGLVEVCDGKDNDCDGKVDGLVAHEDCATAAPRGGSATCEDGRCTPRCDDASHQVENGVCVPPPGSCPADHGCAPGSCVAGQSSYACECPSGYRAGLSRCAPSGRRARKLGFEGSCDGTPTPGTFVQGEKQVPSSLYAACGVASITSSGLTGSVQLFEQAMASSTGITGMVALAGTSGERPLSSELTISFSPAVNDVSFDLADIDNAQGLQVSFLAADGTSLLEVRPPVSDGRKHTRVAHSSPVPVERVVVSYARSNAADSWYIDELAFDVWGCGDGEIEAAIGEVCDDGNAVQCDGCDNGCTASMPGCLAGNACVANGYSDGCILCDVTRGADADRDVVPIRDPLGSISCAP